MWFVGSLVEAFQSTMLFTLILFLTVRKPSDNWAMVSASVVAFYVSMALIFLIINSTGHSLDYNPSSPYEYETPEDDF